MRTLSRYIRRGGTGEEVSVKGNNRGDMSVIQGLPPYAELSRLGKGWQVMTTSAVACLIARPTTTALFTLWNGEEGGGPSYIIDRLFAQQLVSKTAETRWGLWACSHKSMTGPTADITAIKSMSCKATYGGAAVCDVGATVVNDGWFPVGNQQDTEPTGVLGGGQVSVPIEGRFIVPPQCGISLHGVAATVDIDLCVGFAWFEVQIDIE